MATNDKKEIIEDSKKDQKKTEEKKDEKHMELVIINLNFNSLTKT